MYISILSINQHMKLFKISRDDEYAQQYTNDNDIIIRVTKITDMLNDEQQTVYSKYEKIVMVYKIFILLSINKWFLKNHNNFSNIARYKLGEIRKQEESTSGMLNLLEEYMFGDKDIVEDGKIIKSSTIPIYLHTKGKTVKKISI